MKKILFALTVILLAVTPPLRAQNRVEGVVMNESSDALAGVAVVVKGTSRGVSTDARGYFAIEAKKGETLLFSYVGMIDQSIPVTSGRMEVRMVSDNFNLDDVVVIGYGWAKKSDLTGSVASVKPDALKNGKIGMVSQALQGAAAGVQVTQGNMKPGADAAILIRGAGSINAGTEPLYIIDGVPVQGGLQDLSSVDIQSIEILKDASSASIYGSRGSNGVVLGTTKKGTAGKTRVSFNATAGVQKLMNKQEMMTAQQYYDLIESTGQNYTWSSAELRHLSRGESTDWQDAVTQDGSFQNYSFSVSGGSKSATHYLGLDYYDQEGTVKNSSFSKFTVRYNMDAELNKWLRSGVRVNVVESKLMNINEESDSGYGTMHSAITAQPTAPIYNDDGSYFDGFLNTKANPVAIVDLLDKGTKKTRAVGSFYLELEPVKNLRIRSDNGGELVFFKVDEYEDGRMGQHYTADGHARIMSNKKRYWQTENTITYDLIRERHKLTVMGGFSASQIRYEEVTADSKGLDPTTKYNNLGGAATHGPNGSYASGSSLVSFYGRATYNFDERYLVTLTMRGDGSSRFAPGHRWGYFPSLAAAWRVSEEPFMKNASWVDNLKLRISAGMLGNQNIGDYSHAAQISQGGSGLDYVFGGSLASGAVYTTISNPDLTWEKAKQLDLGIDFGFLGNRIAGTIETYYKRTSDLLWTVPLPLESGYRSSMTNVGVLDNKGVEFTLNTVNVNLRNFQWTTSFNISYNRNEIVELYDGKQDVNKSLFVGHSLGEYYLLHSAGIWQITEAEQAAVYGAYPGDREIYDRDGNNVINGEDRVFAGQSTPTWFGGVTNTFRFYGVDLTLFMNFAGGHKINNSLLRSQNSYNVWGNMSRDYYEGYWRIDRPSDVYPAPRVGSAYANGDGTDANLQDGKYLRIKNLEIGYTLPKRWTDAIRASSIRLFFSVQNLATFTAYTGYDVEAWDNTNPYPGSRSYIGGISVNF